MKSFKQQINESPEGPSETHFLHHSKKLLQHFHKSNHAEGMRQNAIGKSDERASKWGAKMDAHDEAATHHAKEIEKHYGHEVLGDIHDTDYGHGNTDRATMSSQLKQIYAGLKK